MKERKFLLGGIVIIAILLSGCIGNNSRPPSYALRQPEIDINVELIYDSPVFYFGDVVQDNGSVNQSKTVNWTLTINNRGNCSEEVRFEIAQARLSADIKKYKVHIDKKLIKDDEPEDKPPEKDYGTRLDDWI